MSGFQNDPVEDGAGEATEQARIDGILEQLRADLQLGHVSDPRATLATRLHEAGIEVDADDLDGMLAGL